MIRRNSCQFSNTHLLQNLTATAGKAAPGPQPTKILDLAFGPDQIRLKESGRTECCNYIKRQAPQ